MKYQNGKSLWLLVILVATLSGCASINQTRASFLGMIYDKDRQPVGGAKVVVTAGLQEKFTGETDIYGRFSFASIPFGKVLVDITRDQYEPFSFDFLFTTESQVFYAQISSIAQLTEAATKALERREWDQSNRLVSKILELDPKNIEASFVRGFLLSQAGKLQEAVQVFKELSQRMTRPYAVHLALADLYQTKLNDPISAASNLEAALTYRYDPQVEARLKALRSPTK